MNAIQYGTSGDDTLSGAGKSDFLMGGAGSDTYFVDSSTDIVEEAPDSGNGEWNIRNS